MLRDGSETQSSTWGPNFRFHSLNGTEVMSVGEAQVRALSSVYLYLSAVCTAVFSLLTLSLILGKDGKRTGLKSRQGQPGP